MALRKSAGHRKAKPTRETSRKGDERRQQILATARKMMMSGGADAIGMRRLAAAVGITHGNLQYYFPTRLELLVVLFDLEVDKYTSGVRAAVAGAKTRKSRVNALMDSGLALIRTPETVLWRQMVGMVDQNPEIAALHAQEIAAYERALAQELGHIEPKLSARRCRHIAKLIQAIVDGLTRREREVLALIAAANENQEIAHTLGVSEQTARNYVHNLYGKLGVSNRTQLQKLLGRLGPIQG